MISRVMERFYHKYSLFGVTFSSDVALALPAADPEKPSQFKLLDGSNHWLDEGVQSVVHEEGDKWVVARTYNSEDVEIEWRRWLSLWIDSTGQTVRYRVKEETYPTAFEAYIANFAVSAALLLQGEETLHATVIDLNGVGIGLLGGSGAGKSTLAAHLIELGGELVTDDMLRITQHNRTLFAEPGQARLKLFKETATRYFPHLQHVGRWNPLSEKYLFDMTDPTRPRERKPLGALLWLAPPETDNPDEVSCKRLVGLELFRVLTGSAMHFKLQPLNRAARQLHFTRWVATELPVYVLRYPRRHEAFPMVFEAIRACLHAASAPCHV